jgi:hypothetical protein
MVDPYADHNIVQFANLAPSKVAVHVLADTKRCKKDTLKPAAEKWVRQFHDRPPLEVRLAPPLTLHDRYIITDKEVWDLGQSFNQLAERSPTSLERSASETEAEKLEWYLSVWDSAKPF